MSENFKHPNSDSNSYGNNPFGNIYKFNILDKNEFSKFLFFADTFMRLYLDRELDLDKLQKDLNELFDTVYDMVDGRLSGIHALMAVDLYGLFGDDVDTYATANAVYNTFAEFYAFDTEKYPVGSIEDLTVVDEKRKGFSL